MIANVEENGPYCDIKGFAFSTYEGIGMGALKLGMSVYPAKTPVPFGEDLDLVEFVCCLSPVDHSSHLKALFHLVNMPADRHERRTETCGYKCETADIFENMNTIFKRMGFVVRTYLYEAFFIRIFFS